MIVVAFPINSFCKVMHVNWPASTNIRLSHIHSAVFIDHKVNCDVSPIPQTRVDFPKHLADIDHLIIELFLINLLSTLDALKLILVCHNHWTQPNKWYMAFFVNVDLDERRSDGEISLNILLDYNIKALPVWSVHFSPDKAL